MSTAERLTDYARDLGEGQHVTREPHGTVLDDGHQLRHVAYVLDMHEEIGTNEGEARGTLRLLADCTTAAREALAREAR